MLFFSESADTFMFNAKLFLFLEAVKKGRVVDCTRDVIFSATLTSKHVLKKESER